jgi:biotin carboxyl carrier protein
VAVRHEVDDPRWHTAWLEPAPFPDPGAVVAGGGPTSPLPGTVTAVLVSPGDVVTTGQVLVVVEAMKMEHPVAAAGPGRVVDVLVEVGRSVEADRLLVVLEPLADQAAAAEGAEGDE